MDALVVGAGTMGRWLGEVLAAVADGVAVADRDRERADRTAGAVGARAVPPGTDERFDLVCVAVPISAAEAAIAEHAGAAERALLDVTGTMAGPVEAMGEHAPDRERVSLHPLFAPDNEPGSVAVVADAPGPVTDAVREALADRGNRLFETTPAEHDAAMETVQAAAHAAVLAYALATEDVPAEFHTPISAGLADLVEELTDGDPGVYAEIQAAFDGADGLAAAARRVADADREAFERLYAAAGERADDL